MLTILEPELVEDLTRFPLGLQTLWRVGNGRPSLIIKSSKESILAARINKGFKVYALPITVDGISTVGLATAFFDDHDEPLVIRTPLLDDDFCAGLVSVLLSPEIDVHFFDELNRELLGYRSITSCPEVARDVLLTSKRLQSTTMNGRAAVATIETAFGVRTKRDDDQALSVTFEASLFPEDILTIDIRESAQAFRGNEQINRWELVREEPGEYQERDIAHLLNRFFPSDQIHMNPTRTTDGEEVADLVVITEERVLVVQAKDRPNTEAILSNTIDRKRAAARKSLKKAVGQVRGAGRYLQSTNPARFRSGSDIIEFELGSSGKELLSLIVLQEMFDDEYDFYGTTLIDLMTDIKLPCLAIDYTQLNLFTSHLDDSMAFFGAYNHLVRAILSTGRLPKAQF